MAPSALPTGAAGQVSRGRGFVRGRVVHDDCTVRIRPDRVLRTCAPRIGRLCARTSALGSLALGGGGYGRGMRVIGVEEFGGPETLGVHEKPEPPAGPARSGSRSVPSPSAR